MRSKLFSLVTLASLLIAGVAGAASRHKMATSSTLDLTAAESARRVTWNLDGEQSSATLVLVFVGAGNGTDIQTTCEGSLDGTIYGKITSASGSNIVAALDDYDTTTDVTIVTSWSVATLVSLRCVFSSTAASAGDTVTVYGYTRE